jgi:4-alpha-glucanotransferase
LPLYTNRWASGAVSPAGHLALESFQLDGSIPVWRFAVGGCWLEQRIWMDEGAPTTYLAWRLLPAPPASVRGARVDPGDASTVTG